MTVIALHNIERLPPLVLDDLDPLRIAETAVAFANSDGGLIVLPAAATGNNVAVHAALSAASELIRPSLSFGDPFHVRGEQGEVWAIYVPRGAQVYALEDGRVLVRTLRTLRELDGEGIRRLAHARAQGDFEAEIVPGATPDDLDEALLAEFAQHAMQDWNGNPRTLWEELGVLTPINEVTVAGILLFGHTPQRWLPEAHILFKHTIAGHVVLEEAIGGTLTHQMRALWEVLSLHAHIDGPRQPYAAALVREVIFNALVHRDYRLRRRPVQVQLSRTDLVVESPGGLSGYLSCAADTLEGRYLRNPRLYAVLSHWGVCQERSAQQLTSQARDAGYPSARWEIAPYSVRVHIRRSVPKVRTTATLTTASLTDRQQRILRLARQRGSVTLRELQARWNGSTSSASLQRDLDILVAAGYLRRFGGRAAVYYVR